MKFFRAVGEIYDIPGGMAVGMSYETKLNQQKNKYSLCLFYSRLIFYLKLFK